jgi:hypothetical protein
MIVEQYFICSVIFPFLGFETCCAVSGKSFDGFLMGRPLSRRVDIFDGFEDSLVGDV